jgi:hypothetical protein
MPREAIGQIVPEMPILPAEWPQSLRSLTPIERGSA